MFALGVVMALQADAASYYVSNSSGNDSNAGTSSSAPWKTLAKVSAKVFAAGDTIYLKRGDVWTGETLYARGGGQSARITVSPYGTGDRPMISPGTGIQSAIELTAECKNWRFVYIAFRNAQYGIYSSCATYQYGFAVESCDFRDLLHSGIRTDPLPGPSPINGFSVINSYFATSRHGVSLRRIANLDLQNNTFSNMQYSGISLADSNGGQVVDCKLTSMGLAQGAGGTCAIYLGNCKNLVIENCEISWTRKRDCPDGVGIDFEANNTNILVQDCYFHDNMGSAILLYRNPDWGSDNSNISLVGNTFLNNGLENPATMPAVMRHYKNAQCGGLIEGNHITLLPGQGVTRIDNGPNLTGFQSSFTVQNNTIVQQ